MAFTLLDEQFFPNGDSSHLHIHVSNEISMPICLPAKQPSKEEPMKSDSKKEAEQKGETRKKTKPIQKEKRKTEKKYEKRKKDQSIAAEMGRPENGGPEPEHLKENKSYNDIVYHFARFLIFLKLKQGEERLPHCLNLTFEQNKWLNRAEEIMAQDNFPAFEEQKPHFLLHPNSPHFVIDFLKKRENKVLYSSEEVQFLMIAYLKRKGLLTSAVFRYLCDYWKDVVFLVNNPNGDSLPSSIPEDFEVDAGDAMEMANSQQQNENVDSNGRPRSGAKKGKAAVSESQVLREELAQDDSIAAYEIACYLHACCVKYSIKVSP